MLMSFTDIIGGISDWKAVSSDSSTLALYLMEDRRVQFKPVPKPELTKFYD